MRRALTAVMAAGMLVGGAVPAAAGLRITKIAFNPKGEDTRTNKHLNKEFVTITNTGSKTKNLEGWKMHDQGRNHTYEALRRRSQFAYSPAGQTGPPMWRERSKNGR